MLLILIYVYSFLLDSQASKIILRCHKWYLKSAAFYELLQSFRNIQDCSPRALVNEEYTRMF